MEEHSRVSSLAICVCSIDLVLSDFRLPHLKMPLWTVNEVIHRKPLKIAAYRVNTSMIITTKTSQTSLRNERYTVTH
jgi:hypothetical protein